MSEQWEFYPCQMGDDPAFVFYDHGIGHEINALELPSLLKIRATFRISTENGLPSNKEFQDLSRLEDILTAAIERSGGAYVGRISVAGARHFHSFVSLEESAAQILVQEIERQSGYDVAYIFEPDPEKKGYWRDLYPTPDDWQVIQDLKVLDTLQEHSDDPTIARLVNHWLYFPDAVQRGGFRQWAADNDFTIESEFEPDEDSDEYGIQISHIARPTLEEISATTILLRNTANEYGGNYDGWETSVETGGVH